MITDIIQEQKLFFATHATLAVKYRLHALDMLEKQIIKHYRDLCDAFVKDMNKHEFDVIGSEVGIVLKEINYFKKHLKKLVKPKRARLSLLNMGGKGYSLYSPYGVCLIVSPWNYPFHLTMMPLIGAVVAGNTSVLKISRKVPSISKTIKDILSCFPSNYIYLTDGEEDLFGQRFDFIFYTGSKKAAQDLSKKQAEYLTPMVLELGGKSPAIIDSDADLKISAKRIVWGKFLNAGQTCVAPDYVLLHEKIRDEWLLAVKNYIKEMYYREGALRPDFVKIISDAALKRLLSLIDRKNIYCGGTQEGMRLAPTVLTDINHDSKIMEEEIFGPVLPVISFSDLDAELSRLNAMPHPLALYYFGKNKRNIGKVVSCCSFGGGMINDVVLHIAEGGLPFGGTGASGLGRYHGKASFYAFSTQKSIVYKKNHPDLALRYPPSNIKKIKFGKFYFKIKKG